jgi:hypothetical protein
MSKVRQRENSGRTLAGHLPRMGTTSKVKSGWEDFDASVFSTSLPAVARGRLGGRASKSSVLSALPPSSGKPIVLSTKLLVTALILRFQILPAPVSQISKGNSVAGCQDITGIPKWTGAKSRIADLVIIIMEEKHDLDSRQIGRFSVWRICKERGRQYLPSVGRIVLSCQEREEIRMAPVPRMCR